MGFSVGSCPYIERYSQTCNYFFGGKKKRKKKKKKIATEMGRDGQAVVSAWVARAFEERLQGDDTKYKELVTQIQNEKQPKAIKRLLLGLGQCVSSLNKKSARLVDAVLGIDLISCLGFDPSSAYAVSAKAATDFLEVYSLLLQNMLSANPYFLRPVFLALVNNLTFKPAVQELPSLYEHIHSLIYSILLIMPSASSTLRDVIQEGFPPKRSSVAEHATYASNVLRVVDYTPELQADIWQFLIENALKLDVEVYVVLDEVATSEETQHSADEHGNEASQGQESQLMFDLEQHRSAAIESGEEDSSSDAEEDDEEEEDSSLNHPKVLEATKKMDAYLATILRYLAACVGRQNFDHGALLAVLLHCFQTQIMPTHRCKYTQYIVFYFCSMVPGYAERYLGFLSMLFMDSEESPMLRHVAVSYIASFLARGKQIDPDLIAHCLHSVLMPWLHSYLDNVESEATNPDLARYSLFYYACQAVFYVICFRHRDLMNRPDGLGNLRRLGIERLVNSRFNPLKVCSRDMVHEFVNVAKAQQIVYSNHILRANKRGEGNEGNDGVKLHAMYPAVVGPVSEADLSESFFVFEPLHLRTANALIDELYQEWDEEEKLSTSSAAESDDESRSESSDMVSSLPRSFVSMSLDDRQSPSSFQNGVSPDLEKRLFRQLVSPGTAKTMQQLNKREKRESTNADPARFTMGF